MAKPIKTLELHYQIIQFLKIRGIHADLGGDYPPWPSATVDNTLRDLYNSSYPTKAEFINCFTIHSKHFLV